MRKIKQPSARGEPTIISMCEINKEIKQSRKERKMKQSIFDNIMKNKKFKKTYDKVAKGLKEAEEGKVTTVGEGKTYSDVEAMLEDMDKYRTWLDDLQSIWYRYFWNYVSSIPLKVKSFIQRGIRGWADEDTWYFDFYLAKVITQGVKHLMKCGNSAWSEKERKSLKEIIKTYETAMAIGDCKLIYVPSKKFTWKRYKQMKRYWKNSKYKGHRPMTLREAKRFEKGFEIFRECYFYLWD